MNVKDMDISWPIFKRGVRKLWDLSEAELDATSGDINKIENIIMSKYLHENPDVVHRMINQLIDSYDNPTDHDPHGLYQTSFERRPPMPDMPL